MAGESVFFVKDDSAKPLVRTSLQAEGLWERHHLQQWALQYPDLLGEGLYVITDEFDRWEGDRLAYQVYESSWVEKGRELLRRRRYEDSIVAFEKSMEYPENFKIGKPAFPRHAPQLFLAGIAYEKIGETEKAETAWLQGAEETHRGWDGSVCVESYYKGLCLSRMGRDKDALALWREMSKGPSRKLWGDAYDSFIMGLGHQALENWPTAVEHLEKAHKADLANRLYRYHLDCAGTRRQAGV